MQDVADQSAAPTTVGADLCAIFVSLELSRPTWLTPSLSPGRGRRCFKHSVSAWNIAALLARFSELRRKTCARAGSPRGAGWVPWGGGEACSLLKPGNAGGGKGPQFKTRRKT